VLGFVVNVTLDSTVTEPESAALVAELIELLEASGLSAGGGGHRALEYVIHRDGSQATEQDRALVRSWAAMWSRCAIVTIGELTDLDADDDAAARASLTVQLLPEPLSVCRLAADAVLPEWALRAGSFCGITRTPDELSIICATANVPSDASPAVHSPLTAREDGWRALKLVGPFALTEVGVLLRVAAPLAAAGISILPVATYETDYVLVRETRLTSAVAELRAAGHVVVGV
jgi:uncharacterized protein YggL (DUF469 family)